MSTAIAPKIVSISGSLRDPSRTATLTWDIAQSVLLRLGGQHRHLPLSEIAPHVTQSWHADGLDPQGRALIGTIESADILVVCTPVYRAAPAGLLKHVFDLVHRDALRGRIAILAATGGSLLHGLVIEHHLRPLLSYFGVHTTPTTLFAHESDFTDGAIANPGLQERIERASGETARLFSSLPRLVEPALP